VYEQDGQIRKLYGFTAVVSYSRMRFVVFTKRCDTPSLIRSLMLACEYVEGLPAAILTDRMKRLGSSRRGRYPSAGTGCTGAGCTIADGMATARQQGVYVGRSVGAEYIVRFRPRRQP
jgi:hypothetical protein